MIKRRPPHRRHWQIRATCKGKKNELSPIPPYRPGYLCNITSDHFIVLCDQIITEDLLFLQRMTNHRIATTKIRHHRAFGHFGELFKDEIHRIHRPWFYLMSKPFMILQEQKKRLDIFLLFQAWWDLLHQRVQAFLGRECMLRCLRWCTTFRSAIGILHQRACLSFWVGVPSGQVLQCSVSWPPWRVRLVL